MKWFKSIHLFGLEQVLDYNQESLQAILNKAPFHACGNYEWTSYGWIAPLESQDSLVLEVNHCLLFTLRKQEKILPSSVIRDFVNEKVEQIEAEQARKVGKREKNEIKEEIIQTLLPRALPRNTDINAYFALNEGWLLIDTPSRNRAEDFANFLRRTLGGLPLVLPEFGRSPAALMTEWLHQQHANGPFTLGEDCKLVAEEGESVTCKQLDLCSQEVQTHLQTGKWAKQLALQWDNRVSFVLDEDFSLKRIKFLDVAQEAQEETAEVDEANDFAMMTLELRGLLLDLFEQLGGLKIENKI